MEVFGDNNSVITSYDFKPNIYSDQDFSVDTLEKLSNDHILNFNLDSDYENVLSCANDMEPAYQEKNPDKN